MQNLSFSLEYNLPARKSHTCIWIGSKNFQIDHPYPRRIIIVDHAISKKIVSKLGTTEEVLHLYGGERTKTRKMKEWVEDELIRMGCNHETLLIAIGGGTILDLVGFVASTFCRGLPYYAVPSTLLAMCDAAIGGKNGVNVGNAKNLIGTIYHPEKVYIDVNFLDSLPHVEMQNGLVEMAKHALLSGPKATFDLEKNIDAVLRKDNEVLIRQIAESVSFKKQIVEESVAIPNKRHLLNFGHTIGHAIESLVGFGISHGKAVAIGIIAECQLAQQLNMLSIEQAARMATLIEAIGLQLTLPKSYAHSEWQQALSHDKKAKFNRPRFVLLKDAGKPHVIGDAYCHEVTDNELFKLFDWINTQFVKKS